MKFLKWLLIIIVAIIAIDIIYGFTQPSQMIVEESIVIDASAEKVFAEIKDFEAWDEWSAWSKMDSAMEQSYKGEKGTIGYQNSWVSENPMVGTGSQEIVEIKENEYLRTKMLFNGEEAENFASFKLSEKEGKTTVIWDMLGAETPVYLRIMNTIFKPMIVDSYQSSLADLKKVVESKPVKIAANPLNLEIVDTDVMKIISIKDSTTSDALGNKIGEIYSELTIFMAGQEGISMAGMPMGMYYSYTPEKVVMEGAFPISGDPIPSGRVMVKEIPAGKAVKGIHYGDYELSGNMHNAIDEFVKAKGLVYGEFCYEIYANDPTEVDSAMVETHIYYPIK